ncbi:MAG: hypothetical protein ABFD79_05300 [Phycisphaerales bacterium]
MKNYKNRKWSDYQNKKLISLVNECQKSGLSMDDTWVIASEQMRRTEKAVEQRFYKLRQKNTETKKRVKTANDNKQSLFRDFAIGAVIGITLIVTTLILL